MIISFEQGETLSKCLCSTLTCVCLTSPPSSPPTDTGKKASDTTMPTPQSLSWSITPVSSTETQHTNVSSCPPQTWEKHIASSPQQLHQTKPHALSGKVTDYRCSLLLLICNNFSKIRLTCNWRPHYNAKQNGRVTTYLLVNIPLTIVLFAYLRMLASFSATSLCWLMLILQNETIELPYTKRLFCLLLRKATGFYKLLEASIHKNCQKPPQSSWTSNAQVFLLW